MRWVNGLTWEAYCEQRQNWHRWFAWFPVVVRITDDGHNVRAWMEYVERSSTYQLLGGWAGCGGWVHQYREAKP